MKMLKISLNQTPTQCRVVLAGRMVGTAVKELRTTYASLKSELKGRALVIDMKEVVLISQEGENTLLQLIHQGAKFHAQGVLARGILHQLAHRSNKQVSDLIDTLPISERKGEASGSDGPAHGTQPGLFQTG